MNKISRNIKLIIFECYIILLSYHIYLLYYCRASVITTLLFYVTLILVTTFISNYFIRRNPGIAYRTNNWKFSIILLFVLLFLVELILKYAIGTYNSYGEMNGGFYYYSQYKGIQYDNMILKRNLGQHNFWIKKMPPGYTRIEDKSEFHYAHTYNSMGLRDREIKVEKDSNEYRIIGIGDSFTEGVGTHQDSTWLRFLETKLNKSPKYNFTTLNAGCSGSDPYYEYMLLKEELLKFNPDLLILVINSSDLSEIFVRGGMERFKPDGLIAYNQGPSWEYLYAFSYIFRHIMHDVLHYDRWLLLRNNEFEKKKNELIDSIYNALVNIKDITVKNGFEFLIVLLPDYHELQNDIYSLKPLALKISKNPDLNFTDLREYYKKAGIDNPDVVFKYYWKIDCHHTSKGYAIMADGIADAIYKNGTIIK
jgi:lysophospholipase L1-like esterase